MTNSQRAGQLIDKYLGDIATAAECVELDNALQANPDVADAFAQAARIDAHLDDFYADRRENQRVQRLLHDLPKQRSRPWFPVSSFRWTAAVLLLAALGIGLSFLPSSAEAVPYMVVSGRVLVDGIENQQIRPGSHMQVVGDEAAVIRLGDDSLAELSPSSKGVLRGPMGNGGQFMELTQGSCEFHLHKGEGPMRVETPVGEVSGRGAEFAVELRPGEKEDLPLQQGEIVPALLVAVMAGNVDVQYGDDRFRLGLGDNRVYAADRPTAARPSDVGGRVIGIAEDGNSFTLETAPPAKKEPPGRRTVRLAEQTRLSFVNVPLRGEKPTVGYKAKIWLAEGSTELALAVNFSSMPNPTPEPDLAGVVQAVSANGKEITLQLPRKTKGEPVRTVAIKIGDETKLSYALVPMDGEKPTVGYNASVWLVQGSKDTASAVTFSGKKNSVPNPDLTGRVTAVSPDGKELTMQRPGKRKGEPGPTVTVKINDKTRLAYPEIDKDKQKPTVGFEAAVWLEKGSQDAAASIRFGALPGNKGDPTQPGAPKGDALAAGIFALPKGIEWTVEQTERLAALQKELQPEYQKWLQKNDAVLSPEQKAALQVVRRAVKEAGLSDKQQIQQVFAVAANITPEQQARMDALAREAQDLRQKFLDQVKVLLTPEQKAKLPKGALEANSPPTTKP
jgi:FecR protein